MPPVKSLGNSRAQYNYKFGLTGFEAALPPPGLVYSDDVFSTTLWDGTGLAHEIETGIDNTGNSLLWTKSRNYTNSHRLYTPAVDTAIGYPSLLYADIANAHGSYMSADLSGFTANGFTVTDEPNASTGAVNSANLDYVAWNFKEAPGFFTIKTWVGDGQGDRYLDHDLGSVPGFVIVKNLTDSQDWGCYHLSLGASLYGGLTLNQNYESGNTNIINPIRTTPTASQIHIRGAAGEYNTLDKNYVAYIFAHDDQRFGTDKDESIIKCGDFTAHASGVSVDIGWEPQFVMWKSANVSGNWHIQDMMRGMSYGPDSGERLFPNTNDDEDGTFVIGTNSTGFDVKPSFYADNTSIVYIAIRRPHKPITVPTKLFAVDIDSVSATIPTWDSGFPVDMAFYFDAAGGPDDQRSASRLLGAKQLITSSTVNESSDGSLVWDSNNGWGKDYDNNDWYSYMFRRAPGFFDVVAYSSVTTTTYADIAHNLGVQPELVIIKGRDTSTSWHVWSTALSKVGYLNLDGHFESDNQTLYSSMFYNTDPTATTFRVGTSAGTNQQGTNGNYIAYLFASLPNVSKIGTYSGTGGAFNVDCGFSSSARFVLIKRTDPTGQTPNNAGWRVYDTSRGIVDGNNDPYINLNDNDPQVTNNDGIDPYQNGFALTGSGNFEINANGGTYLYLAIA